MHKEGSVHDGTFPRCPICGADSDLVRNLPAEHTRSALMEYYGPTLTAVETRDYSIRRCSACTLEFADPLDPGTAEFYEQLGQQADYYPTERWEWSYVLSEIKARQIRTVLEIGCGSGSFMQKLRAIPGCSVTGVDINPMGIAKCRSKCLNAFCETAEEHLQRTGMQYDCTVSFHCLEHVSAPLEFARTVHFLTHKNGRMYLSTPFSPMSFEGLWYDPLNHPPHHMTRWNAHSYQVLARNLGLQCRLASPTAGSALRRAAMSVALCTHRSPGGLTRARIRGSVMLHPVVFARDLFRQVQRERLDGKPAGDVVLAIFSAGDCGTHGANGA